MRRVHAVGSWLGYRPARLFAVLHCCGNRYFRFVGCCRRDVQGLIGIKPCLAIFYAVEKDIWNLVYLAMRSYVDD